MGNITASLSVSDTYKICVDTKDTQRGKFSAGTFTEISIDVNTIAGASFAVATVVGACLALTPYAVAAGSIIATITGTIQTVTA